MSALSAPLPTIYALATLPGRAALAVIRISGSQAAAAVQALGGRVPCPRHATLMTLRDPANDAVLDQALVTYFAAPASFTGEDSAELSLHGGAAVVAGVIQALSRLPGLRLAEPGEFTKRAFLNGKMDLTAAEAVADLIHAETSLQRAQALAQLGGSLHDLYDGWRTQIIHICAYLEVHLDFADQDVPDDLVEQIRPKISQLQAAMAQHVADGHRGEILRDGARVVILGAPNAGKSSLLNALARREVAIVSEYAGTTRDVIDVHLDIDGYPVTLTDTAGLRPDELGGGGQDGIEAEGIRRALARSAGADVKIVLLDGATLPDLNPHSLSLIDDHTLVVVNKSDIAGHIPDYIAGHAVIAVSAQTGAGLADVVAALKNRLVELVGQGEGAVLTRARHRDLLQEAVAALAAAGAQTDTVLLAEELRGALNALGRLTGRVDVEDLLDVIFRDFCIGK